MENDCVFLIELLWRLRETKQVKCPACGKYKINETQRQFFPLSAQAGLRNTDKCLNHHPSRDQRISKFCSAFPTGRIVSLLWSQWYMMTATVDSAQGRVFSFYQHFVLTSTFLNGQANFVGHQRKGTATWCTKTCTSADTIPATATSLCLDLLASPCLDPRALLLTPNAHEEDLWEGWKPLLVECLNSVDLANLERGIENYPLSEWPRWTKWETGWISQSTLVSLDILPPSGHAGCNYSPHCTTGGLSKLRCLHALTCIFHYLKVAFKEVFVGMMDASQRTSFCILPVGKPPCCPHLHLSWEILLSPASPAHCNSWYSRCFSKDWVSQDSAGELS